MRALIRTVFVVVPAILLSAYTVFLANSFLSANGVHIHPLLYQVVLSIVIWVAMWLTAKPIIDDLRKRARERKAEQRDDL